MKSLLPTLLLFFLSFQYLFAQKSHIDSLAYTKVSTKTTEDLLRHKTSDSVTSHKKLYSGIDFTSRYIWRGQVYGGDFIAIQPWIEYALSNKFIIGVWASTNFRNNTYLHNQFNLRGYNEIEFYIIYTINDYLSLSLHDYYSPIQIDDKAFNNSFLYYGNFGAKTVDFNINFDLSEKKLPITGLLSTYLAGYDYRYNANDKNPTQNFTTYLETTYTFKDVFKDLNLNATAGIVFNNAAESYVNADYDKPSLTNLKLEAIKTFKLTNNLQLPISLSYINNASKRNTEVTGRHFFQAMLSLVY